jgi:hypothetical protein
MPQNTYRNKKGVVYNQLNPQPFVSGLMFVQGNNIKYLERYIMNMSVGYIHIFFYEYVYVSAIFHNRYMLLKQHELCCAKSFTRNVFFKIKITTNFNSEKTKV